jgi:hypothetical protein
LTTRDAGLRPAAASLGAREQNTLICETNFSGSSSVEAVISVSPWSTAGEPEIREPQVGQKRRVIGWPLPPFFVNSVSLPVIETAPSGTASTQLWPVPLVLRQSSQ